MNSSPRMMSLLLAVLAGAMVFPMVAQGSIGGIPVHFSEGQAQAIQENITMVGTSAAILNDTIEHMDKEKNATIDVTAAPGALVGGNATAGDETSDNKKEKVVPYLPCCQQCVCDSNLIGPLGLVFVVIVGLELIGLAIYMIAYYLDKHHRR